MKPRSICPLLMSLILVISLLGCAAVQTRPSMRTTDPPLTEPLPAEPDPWGMTTMEIVRDMGIGINLGNTFEACGDWVDQWGDGSVESYVTCWGSPIITREMIEGFAEEGFGVLRIPVHWFNLMGEDYTLSPEYLASVKQTVDWALDAQLYVIINIHHDEDGFFAGFPQNREASMAAYSKIWTQIA